MSHIEIIILFSTTVQINFKKSTLMLGNILYSYILILQYSSPNGRSLAEACSEGDVNAVRKLLIEGRSVNEHTEEGESLLCLAGSAGYYELAQVCIFKIKLTVLFFFFFIATLFIYLFIFGCVGSSVRARAFF